MFPRPSGPAPPHRVHWPLTLPRPPACCRRRACVLLTPARSPALGTPVAEALPSPRASLDPSVSAASCRLPPQPSVLCPPKPLYFFTFQQGTTFFKALGHLSIMSVFVICLFLVECKCQRAGPSFCSPSVWSSAGCVAGHRETCVRGRVSEHTSTCLHNS